MGQLHVSSLSISEGVLPLSTNYRENLGQTALKSTWFGYILEVVQNKSSKWCLNSECCYAQYCNPQIFFFFPSGTCHFSTELPGFCRT